MLKIPINCPFETLLPARLFPPAQAVELVITDVVSPGQQYTMSESECRSLTPPAAVFMNKKVYSVSLCLLQTFNVALA